MKSAPGETLDVDGFSYPEAIRNGDLGSYSKPVRDSRDGLPKILFSPLLTNN
jgi:hypothetical protein